MSDKGFNFIEVVQQVVRVNRNKSRKPTTNMSNMLLDEVDRDMYLAELMQQRRRSSLQSQYFLAMQSANGSHSNLPSQFKMMNNNYNRRQSQLSTAAHRIIVEADGTPSADNTIAPMQKFPKISPLDFSSDDDSDSYTIDNRDYLNSTKRLISTQEGKEVEDFSNLDKRGHANKLRRMNTHPSLKYLGQIIATESVLPDQIQIMNLYLQLKMYEFITALLTLISNCWV
jgi:hypothetical protein